jgi:hypothetical protein
LRWLGFGVVFGMIVGAGREAIVVVGGDGGADGFAPAVGAEGVDLFELRGVDGLHKGLGQVSDSTSEFGLYIAADDGGDKAREGGAEITGGEIVAGEEAGEVFAEFFRGLGAGLLLGMEEAEMGMVANAGSAATAAIGEREQTQGHAVLWT